LEEPSGAFGQAPDIASVISTNEPIYKAERQDDLEEAFFALHLLVGDFNKLRTEVSHAWAGYKDGLYDLIAASITTNTAVDLTRSMADDLKSMFAKHGGGIRMLQVYYAAQCLEAGKMVGYKLRSGDDMNFETYKLADTMFYPAFQLLDAFCRVLQAGPDPQMKRGIYGYYEPHSDRDAKSNREKFVEDKILLLEMLEEFYFYFRTTKPPGSQPPVEDELIRGLRTMFETKEVTLTLAFATTLFLDIHHILRHDAELGFHRMRNFMQFVQVDVEEGVDFHKGIDMETWPAENDKAVQQFIETLQFWCRDDQQRIAAQKLKRLNIPIPFCLYRNHPWLCGMWKYYAQMRFHEISIVFVNAWGSVMSCAHLYNAVQGGKTKDIMWKDMDVVIQFQGEKAFFIGEHPTSSEDCLKRFALAMGASATSLAKSTRKKKGLTLSKRGPKGLKEGGTILQTFKGRICDGNGQNDINAEHVQKILEGSSWGYELNEDGRVNEVYKDTDEAPKKVSVKHLHVSKLLGLVRDVIHAETVEIAFDYLRLHRMCWRLLRFVKEHCHNDLTRMFGPSYIEKESQLPFIVGYVLMSATSSQQMGDMLKARLPGVEVTDKLLAEAKSLVQGLVEGIAGALVVEHVLPEIGVRIDFEFEREE
jgi:hypothetical protein